MLVESLRLGNATADNKITKIALKLEQAIHSDMDNW